MDRWQGKVAVVTGASCGIGAAVARELASQGMIVVALARRVDRIEKEVKATLPAAQQARFHAQQCDVTREEDILRVFEWVEKQLGGVDVLINNAGVVRQTQIIAPHNTADLRAVLDTNVMGVALCTREAFKSMRQRDVDGHVVIINSVAGHKVLESSGNNVNLYASSKYAVTAMTEVLRQEFLQAKSKTKVTSISPGVVETEIFHFPPSVPRLQPKDITDAVIFCLQTPPHVQIHELTIKPVGEKF